MKHDGFISLEADFAVLMAYISPSHRFNEKINVLNPGSRLVGTLKI